MKKILMVLALVAFAVANLSINDESKYNVNVETYKVRTGDTFWDITRRYYRQDERDIYFFEYQDEIRDLNPHLRDVHYQLEPNDKLNVRYMTRQ